MVEKNWSYTIPENYIIKITVFTESEEIKEYKSSITYKEYLLYKSLINFINFKGLVHPKDLLDPQFITEFEYNILESFKNKYLNTFSDNDAIINIGFIATDITEITHPGKTIWSGRYTAVKAIIITSEGILVNKRGKGCPDFVGCWNLPSGFLEMGETAAEGISREVYEECSYKLPSNVFRLFRVNTDPKNSNNGNVTITLITFIPEISKYHVVDLDRGGEKNEVDSVEFVNSSNNKEWAFHDKEIIDEVLERLKVGSKSKYNNSFIDYIFTQGNDILC